MACGTVKLATSTKDDVALASADYPGITLTDLNHGKEVIVVQCGNCHKIYKHKKISTDLWDEIVPKIMVAKLNKQAAKAEKSGIDAAGEETCCDTSLIWPKSSPVIDPYRQSAGTV